MTFPVPPLLSRRHVLGAGGSLLLGAIAPAAAQEAPRRGGSLRIALPDPPDTLDPQANSSFTSQQVSALIYDNLLDIDAQGQPKPGLATQWQAERDGQEWVFDLRQGVTFHHGRPFTSADVVATLNRLQDPALRLRGRGTSGPIRAVTAEGPFRVRIALTRPFGELPMVLASNRWGRILPADGLDALATAPQGTGAFRYQAFEPGASVTLVANKDYWIAGQPYVDEIRLLFISNAVAQQQALRGGLVDIVGQLPVESLLLLRRVPNLDTYSVPTGGYQTLMTQSNLPPFTDPTVRLAFKYIMDRPGLVASALFGQGVVGNDVPVPPGNLALPSLEQYGQDLPRARALLKQAGVGPLSLDLWTTSERPPSPKMAVAFAEAAGQVGVKITIRDTPYTEYAATVVRKKPLYTAAYGAAASLYESVYQIYHSTGSGNFSGVAVSPETDLLLDDMISQTDPAAYKAAAGKALASIHALGGRIIPYFQNYCAASVKSVRAFTPPRFTIIDARPIWLAS